VKKYKLMSIAKFLNIEKLKNKDLFDIKSFVIVFSIYSLISIACADVVYQQDRKIKTLREDLKEFKAQYISVKTQLMSETKESALLTKAELFGFVQPSKPTKIIYCNDEY
tara:strand:+ start:154 stop:483 length:330 start_codon:yes stop_codon:yes gene_type:complete